MKAAGLGQEVGGVTWRLPAIGGHRGLPADCFGRGWVSDSPAVAGKGSATSREQREWGLSSGRTAGGAQIAWCCPTR